MLQLLKSFHFGATPVFVDVYESTFNIDCNKLEKEIKKYCHEGKLKPKAIIPVDLFGLPARYRLIDKIAKKYNLKVIEDAAKSFGGSIRDKKVGSFGDVAATSFYPAKPLVVMEMVELFLQIMMN